MIDREARIRERAYQLWEQEGRPEGGQERHWRQASDEIDAEPGNGALPNGQETGLADDLRAGGVAPTTPAADMERSIGAGGGTGLQTSAGIRKARNRSTGK